MQPTESGGSAPSVQTSTNSKGEIQPVVKIYGKPAIYFDDERSYEAHLQRIVRLQLDTELDVRFGIVMRGGTVAGMNSDQIKTDYWAWQGSMTRPSDATTEADFPCQCVNHTVEGFDGPQPCAKESMQSVVADADPYCRDCVSDPQHQVQALGPLA